MTKAKSTPTAARSVDMSLILTDLDGVALQEPYARADGSPRPSTLGRICARALVENLAGDAPIDAVEKLRWFTLAQRLVAGGELDLDDDDVALLKERVAKAYGVLVVGQVFTALGAA